MSVLVVLEDSDGTHRAASVGKPLAAGQQLGGSLRQSSPQS